MHSHKSEFEKKSYVEVKTIEIDRFDEGVRLNKDPRDDGDYDLAWVLKNAVRFNNMWEKCLCRTCIKCEECGIKLTIECKDYLKE
jgi:hypothetical protein